MDWDPDAAELVVTSSACYPYFLQEFGKATWDFAPGPGIAVADAEAGLQVGTARLDRGLFTSRWERATAAERDYLRAMAAGGDRPAQSGEVARRLGKRQSSVGPVRASLIYKGLISAPEHGSVAFTVPGMAAFIERQPRA